MSDLNVLLATQSRSFNFQRCVQKSGGGRGGGKLIYFLDGGLFFVRMVANKTVIHDFIAAEVARLKRSIIKSKSVR